MPQVILLWLIAVLVFSTRWITGCCFTCDSGQQIEGIYLPVLSKCKAAPTMPHPVWNPAILVQKGVEKPGNVQQRTTKMVGSSEEVEGGGLTSHVISQRLCSFQNIGFRVYNFSPENCSVPCLELSVTWGDQQQKFWKVTPRQCCQQMGFFKITFLQSFKLSLS